MKPILYRQNHIQWSINVQPSLHTQYPKAKFNGKKNCLG